jgi:hypothetical protein
MSSISEESETGDDEESMVQNTQEEKDQLPINLNVENCLGDLNTLKKVRFHFYLILFPVDRSISFKQTYFFLNSDR